VSSFYVTTPIYYVNANPHMGHAYTSIAADVLRRWHAMLGDSAWMLTGTDEHGQKVYESALARGLSPAEHVDGLQGAFRDLLPRIAVETSDFIRTTEPRHTRVVQAVLQQLWEAGDIYAADYEGWYSKSAERFFTEKDLVDGRCPETGTAVEWVKEQNYFFRMSKYADRLRAWIGDHPDFIRPEARRNEVIGYLRKEVTDLCISRPAVRLPWGIPLPFAPDYVTYVWFDALLNYLTAIGYHPDEAQRSSTFSERWPADVQLIGKDILIPHAVYWSTMLFALGLEPATTLYVHGWWTVAGTKMSKSFGNVVDPNLLVDAYGPDAVRYFLLRELPFGGDGEFQHEAFLTRVNADLANDLGNLAHRAISMSEKWLGGMVPALDSPSAADLALEALAARTYASFVLEMQGVQFSRALEVLWELVKAGNNYLQVEEPWKLNRLGQTERLAGVMRRALEICRVAALLLAPFCPAKAAVLGERLGGVRVTVLHAADGLAGLRVGAPLTLGEPLFPRLDGLPPLIVEAIARAEAAAAAEAAQRPAPPSPSSAPKNEPKPMSETSAPAAPAESAAPAPLPELIDFDTFGKVALRAGLVLAADRHPKADRLLVLQMDLGEGSPRTIVAGIAARFTPEELVGKTVVVVANLKPAKLRGIQSHGMVLAAGDGDGLALLTVTSPVAPGTAIR
jgi:methionyl-tRNA synthetase